MKKSIQIQHRELEVRKAITEEIPIRRGIKQGCPLSPMLFNLVLEGVIPEIEKMNGSYTFENGTTIRILAYADDICLVDHTKRRHPENGRCTSHPLLQSGPFLQSIEVWSSVDDQQQ